MTGSCSPVPCPSPAGVSRGLRWLWGSPSSGAGIPRCEREGSAASSEQRIFAVKAEGSREVQQGLERGKRKESGVQKRKCLAEETSV